MNSHALLPDSWPLLLKHFRPAYMAQWFVHLQVDFSSGLNSQRMIPGCHGVGSAGVGAEYGFCRDSSWLFVWGCPPKPCGGCRLGDTELCLRPRAVVLGSLTELGWLSVGMVEGSGLRAESCRDSVEWAASPSCANPGEV